MIDSFVFTALEAVTHRLQRTFGFTNFAICRVLAVVIGCLYLLGLILPSIEFSWAHGLMTFAMFIDSTWTLRYLEQRAFSDLQRSLANPLKVSTIELGFRLTWWFLMAYDIYKVVYQPSLNNYVMVIISATLLLYVYLRTCDPLPPGDSTFKRWLRGLTGTTAQQRT